MSVEQREQAQRFSESGRGVPNMALPEVQEAVEGGGAEARAPRSLLSQEVNVRGSGAFSLFPPWSLTAAGEAQMLGS